MLDREREEGERDFAGEGVGSENGKKRASPSAQTPLHAALWLPLASPALLPAQAICQPWQTGCRELLLFVRSECVTNVNCMLTALVQQCFAADRCLSKPPVSSRLECG